VDTPAAAVESLLAAPPHVFQHLRSLRLDHVASITDAAVSSLLRAASGSLEALSLHHVAVTDASLEALRQTDTSRLQSLSLRGLRDVTSGGLEALFTPGLDGLHSPPALRRLELASLHEETVTDDVVGAAAAASAPEGLGSGAGFVRLDVGGSSSLTDLSMEHVARHCAGSLQELDVGYCHRISDKGLGYLVSVAGRQLRTISLWGCAQITDNFLDGHARAGPGSGLDVEGVWMRKSGPALQPP